MFKPNFNPVALNLGYIKIHWYAISYVVGFTLFYFIGKYRIKKGLLNITIKQLDDLLNWGIIGVILGGRLGYVLFYQLSSYIQDPLEIFKIWHGGMSFHGGLIGVIIVIFLFSLKNKIKFIELTDFITPLAPLGLAFGRIGNFVNGELFGRITDINNWFAMGFYQAKYEDLIAIKNNPQLYKIYYIYQALPRHPSQLYESFLEGFVLFLILFLFSKKKRKLGTISALFILLYGIFRFIIEFTREPDSNLGLLSLGLSMGQWLSIPMIIIGIIWLIYSNLPKKSLKN